MEVTKKSANQERGGLGSGFAWIPTLLLSTQDRRTGLVRTMPLAFMADPEEAGSDVIVASNGGIEREIPMVRLRRVIIPRMTSVWPENPASIELPEPGGATEAA